MGFEILIEDPTAEARFRRNSETWKQMSCYNRIRNQWSQRWNRLSRLQMSFVYAAVTVAVTVLVLLLCFTTTNVNSSIENKDSSQDSTRNVSVVIEPTVETITQSEQRDRPVFTGPRNARQSAVVESFKHAWKGYKKHAWGHDQLKPVSGVGSNGNTMGLTIVDSLDTAYIMGLTEEFEEGRQWIKDELIFTNDRNVGLFGVTIKVLGALLTNYHFTQDEMFLNKAKDLGERLMAAFLTPSGIPYPDVNLGTKIPSGVSSSSTTSEVTTLQLEFRELSRTSGNLTFEHAVMAVSEKIHALPKMKGLVPIYINRNTGQFVEDSKITLGARGDSYYEYLMNQWLQTGKTINFLLDDYKTAIEGVRDVLAKRTSPNKHLFIGELQYGTFRPKMDHLACFLPGTLALGHANGLPDWHMKMAEELLYTCYLMYEVHPTFLAPEITYFNMDVDAKVDMYTNDNDAHSILRSEFVESLWIMYQITGNTTYQDWGWKVFQAFEKHAKVSNGYTSLRNVKSEKPDQRDEMASLFLSETIKYMYLLFSDDRFLIDLNKFVMNAGAHPLPIHEN